MGRRGEREVRRPPKPQPMSAVVGRGGEDVEVVGDVKAG